MNLVYNKRIRGVIGEALSDCSILNLFNELRKYHLPSAEHSYRVAEENVLLTESREMTEEDILAAKAGFTHDIGKLEIPLHILNKPTRLTPEEREIMEQHPRRGFNLLKGYEMSIRCVAAAHHESQTNPYPRKKYEWVENERRENKYSTLIEKIAAADMFDALIHPRAYKTVLGLGEVEQIMMIQFRRPASYREALVHPETRAA